MKIRCLTIDDEPYALKQMAGYILKTPFLELSGKCKNAFEAMEFMASNPIDLIFVDINIPEMSGMDFVKTLPPDTNIIFTTAYSQYAVESYKVDAIDYLLKPITYDDFLRSVNKARSLIESRQMIHPQVRYDDQFLFIKSEYRIVRINFDDIQFVEAMSEYVKIHLINASPVMSLMSMKSLEEQLPPEKFMRVHRSFIVNLTKISIIERNRIVFSEDVYIPVSDQYKSRFQSWVDKNFIL